VPYAHIELAPTPPEPATTEASPTAPEPAAPAAAATPAAPAATPPVAAPPPPHDESVARRPSPDDALDAHQPLTVTPALQAGPYAFPLAGEASFGDSYGGLRTDVHGAWHHGDDIFAPLGTPVVAVADGTLNRVGWERLGGWRLWVRDRAGDQFYYAHLAGYSPLALRRGTVHRGDVIGFVGNTGDAFTTLPHLHFEVHPRELLFLRYDGAVDPTTYLYSWPRPDRTAAPLPVHPRLPHLARFRHEALQNFRELLAARSVKRESRKTASPFPSPRLRPEPRIAAASVPAPHGRRSSGRLVWVALDSALAVAALGLVLRQRRRRRAYAAGDDGRRSG
jgi:hypothetical protein